MIDDCGILESLRDINRQSAIIIHQSLKPFPFKDLGHRLGIDPAVISNPLLTNIVDWTGLFLYFTLAQWLVFGR
jgi:magnesium transporter